MVNPGAFKGARKEFLMGEKAAYSQAVNEGYVAEAVAKIQRKFFKRFPLDLPEDQDPSPEELAAVNDDEVEPEYPQPDPDTMSKEVYEAAMVEVEARKRQISFKQNQIKRWLAYQHLKDHDVDAKSSGAHNPYRALLCKLTGQSYGRPRTKTPCNVWRKTQREAIEERVRVIAAETSIPKGGMASLRDKVARDMFGALSTEERKKWRFTAEEESIAAQQAWEEEMNGRPSTSPEDRQRCILGLVRFIQPILDLVCEATGWKATFIAGGPEPASAGRLNVISVHSGKTTGDVPLDFGTLEREGYKKKFLPMYGRFLKKCYSVEECHARALKPEDSLSLEAAEPDSEGAGLFHVESTLQATAPPSLPPQAARKARKVTKALSTPSEGSAKTSGPPAPSATRQAPDQASTAKEADPTRTPDVPHSIAHPRPPLMPHNRYPTAGRYPPATVPDSPNFPPLPPACPSSPSPCSSRRSSIPPYRAPSPPPSAPSIVPPSSLPSPPAPSSPPHVPSSMCPISQSAPPSTPPLSLISSPRECESRPQTPPPSPPLSPPASPMMSAVSSLLPTTSPVEIMPEPRSNSEPPPPNTACRDPEIVSAPPTTTGTSQVLRRSKRRLSVGQSDSEPRPAKKGRASKRLQAEMVDHGHVELPTSDDSEVPLVSDANAPDWFRGIVEMLQGRDLLREASWAKLIQLWSRFEMQAGYEETKRLSAVSRPEVIAQWLHRKRSPTFQPEIDLRRYSKDFMTWWTNLQPDWRLSRKKILFDTVQGDWESLRRPGINGIVNVLVALFFWGTAIKKGRRNGKDWELAVKDCSTALEQLLIV